MMKRSHLLALGISILFWICLLLILFGCSQKVHHRPRYNHWAKPYKMTGAMSISDYGCELILVVQSEMERLGGKFSLGDAAKVADQVEKWNKPQAK